MEVHNSLRIRLTRYTLNVILFFPRDSKAPFRVCCGKRTQYFFLPGMTKCKQFSLSVLEVTGVPPCYPHHSAAFFSAIIMPVI